MRDGLEFDDDAVHVPVAALVPRTGTEGWIGADISVEPLVETHQLPPDTLRFDAAAADLPAAHQRVAIPVVAESVHLDETAVAVVAKF